MVGTVLGVGGGGGGGGVLHYWNHAAGCALEVLPYVAETALWGLCWGHCIVVSTRRVLCCTVVSTLKGTVLGIAVGTAVARPYCGNCEGLHCDLRGGSVVGEAD